MKTLDAWLHLLGATPRTFDYPSMELLSGRDGEPSVFVGRGQVVLNTPNSFEFTLTGQAFDTADAMRRMKKSRENPYEVFEQFRLIGTDTDGVQWAFGWTTPRLFDFIEGEWSISGAIQVLSTDVQNSTAVSRGSAENIVELPSSHPMMPIVGGFTAPVNHGSSQYREHKVSVLDTEINFAFFPQSRQLAICCSTSSQLSHPFIENWLTEPFRIMFGQSVYPRLIARNFVTGRAMVSLRPSPGVIRNAGFASLWSHYPNKTKEEFWNLYSQILTFIASARGPDGSQNFQENTLTQHYEEIAQAARGTRWVWALTLASTIEGQAKMLVRPGTLRPGFDSTEADDLADHIGKWSGSLDLKSQAIGAIKSAAFYTATRVLAELRDTGIIEKQELESWKSIRNEVSHGTLISPWSQREEDEKLQHLASLFHKLTIQVLSRSENG
jgi:hypothetical protein